MHNIEIMVIQFHLISVLSVKETKAESTDHNVCSVDCDWKFFFKVFFKKCEMDQVGYKFFLKWKKDRDNSTVVTL